MTTLLWLMALAVVLFVVTPWASKRLRNRTLRLENAIKAMDASYEFAQSLIQDEAVPEILVPFIVWFQGCKGKPSIARMFTVDLVRGRTGARTQISTTRGLELEAAIDTLNDKQQELFGLMLASGMASCAYSDWLFSKYHLNIWQAVMSQDSKRDEKVAPPPEKIRTVVSDLNHKYEKTSNLCAA